MNMNNTQQNLESIPSVFIEYTLLSVFLWIGLWGLVSLFIDKYFKSFGSQSVVYIFMVIVSFSLLHRRNHI